MKHDEIDQFDKRVPINPAKAERTKITTIPIAMTFDMFLSDFKVITYFNHQIDNACKVGHAYHKKLSKTSPPQLK